MPTLNWVFENHLMVTGIVTQPSSRKQFASRRKKNLKSKQGQLEKNLSKNSVKITTQRLTNCLKNLIQFD